MISRNTYPYLLIGGMIVVVGIVMMVPRFLAVVRQQALQGTASLADVALQSGAASPSRIIAVNANDHVRGNRSAPIKVVEYSDFQCPFCSQFHPVLKQLITEFPDKVQWIYRHFPIASIHGQATPAALASECVAELGGNQAFWQFSDIMFSQQQSLGIELYQQSATSLGISLDKFNACLNSGKYEQKVQAHFQNALDTGGRGTPHTIIIMPDGRNVPLFGVATYDTLKGIIDSVN